MIARADEAAYILVRGADARAFLHAQLTCRVMDLRSGETRLGAWCSANGRVRALFRLLGRGEDILYMRLPAALRTLVLPRLRMFVLRSAVDLMEIAPDSAEHDENERLAAVPEDLAEIEAGVPEVYPETSDLFIPQMLNLDRLGAIDFHKGCYPGQEIVARAQYRGQVKRRLFRLSCDAPASPGTDIVSADHCVGTVVRAAPGQSGTRLLAVVQIDAARADLRLASPAGARLTGAEPTHPEDI